MSCLDTVTLRRYRISLSCGIDGGANGAKPFRKDTLGNFGGFHVGFRKTKKGLHRSPFYVHEHQSFPLNLERKVFVLSDFGFSITSEGVPISSITPSDINITVSATSRANDISCVTVIIVRSEVFVRG